MIISLGIDLDGSLIKPVFSGFSREVGLGEWSGYRNVFGQTGLANSADRDQEQSDQSLHCNSLCIFWMHYSEEMPSCNNINFWVSEILGFLRSVSVWVGSTFFLSVW